MQNRRKLLLRVIAATVLLGAYPAFVLGYTWSYVARADLPGGRHGPLDAYRHALASAVVAYSVSPHVVEWTSRVMERSGNPANVMDRHNNRIGAAIGSRARSFGEIEPTVHAQVLIGTDNATEPAQITWLSREQWRKGWLW